MSDWLWFQHLAVHTVYSLCVWCMVATCSLMALISSSSCGLLWLPFCWSSCFRACSSLDMALSTSIAYTHKSTSERKQTHEIRKHSKRKHVVFEFQERPLCAFCSLLDMRRGLQGDSSGSLSQKSNSDREQWNHTFISVNRNSKTKLA